MFKKSFQHLKEVDESYLEHMFFALQFALGCFAAAYYAALHAFVPGLYKSKSSDKIRGLYSQLEGRNNND